MCRVEHWISRLLGAACALVLAISWAEPAFAIDQFILDKEDGWFWYEREPEPETPVKPPEIKPEPKNPVEPAPPKKTQPQKVEPLSVEWFQKEYQQILNKAIDEPSQENVRKYRYATRVMLDKASNFTHVFQRESLLDPLLDEANRMPFSSASRGSFMRLTIEEQAKAIKAISEKAGLWVFLDESCAFCALQYPIVARMAQDRKLTVIYITPDGKRPPWMAKTDDVRAESGQSKFLRIGVRPAVAVVVPPENVTVLTQGLLSQDMLEERLLFAGDQSGLLSKEISDKAFPERRGLLTPDDIKEIGGSMSDDTKSFTNSVQDRLQKRY
ncbi:conjugal transfer protein TraF [Alicycliphilus denitrificans]|uniref:conjugal transfer protein TraF n=1 Tax=Alicycliphilus denitrificans TaxID=179636 RepID=UPI0001DA02BC|nr:conjugal transfer protein TraF [Alicycliphilus denitrificans]ADV02146.1 sex pilus assembly protein [Alicycliphilus denitrificans BC]